MSTVRLTNAERKAMSLRLVLTEEEKTYMEEQVSSRAANMRRLYIEELIEKEAIQTAAPRVSSSSRRGNDSEYGMHEGM